MGIITRVGVPVGLIAAESAPDEKISLAAKSIMDMNTLVQSSSRRAEISTLGGAAKAGGVIARTASRVGMRGAAELAVEGLPIAGQVIGGSMLAYDVFRLGYRVTTGKSFDDTAVGKFVTKTSNGAIHLAANAAGGMFDIMGMKSAAYFSRNTVSEILTGTPSRAEPSSKPEIAPPAGQPTTLAAGPSRKISIGDIQERPIQNGPHGPVMPTSQISRTAGVLDMLTDDLSIQRGPYTPGYTAAKSAALQKPSISPSTHSNTGITR